ncbi:helix-turn-helix domain-containing protein [Neorhizobium petrolearium]|uniref:helix-turn-helix domain-containing protein n=1 Tax=Neorhizobium petrolearium TaxID=515361 RepID=UPI003F7F5A33
MTDCSSLIRDLMKQHRVTQRDLEAASGVSRSTIKRLLRGDGSISLHLLDTLLSAMGYSLTLQKTGSPSPLFRRSKKLAARPMRGRGIVRSVGAEGF